MAYNTEATEMECAEVERERWSNQPDGFRLKIGFKRQLTPPEIEDRAGLTTEGTTIDREEYKLSSLVRQHSDDDLHGFIHSRSDVTKEVVEAAVEEALGVYCESRFDPEEVCVHRVHVEEYHRIRTVTGSNENDVGVSQPHSSGELPGWADE